jgi:two-component system, NarL family, nitrate/nitrite response regulator NarL
MKTPGITAWHALADHEQRLDRLNRAELKVLEQLSMDASNGEIAQQLYVTEQAVGNHVLHILDKLVLANRLDAGRFARRNGLRAA